MRILIVEDNPIILENLADFLSANGFIVNCAQNGLTVLQLISTEPYDLILLDLILPGIGGLTLCDRIRKNSGLSTPIIMLTARDQQEDKIIGLQHGADDYWVKPFDLDELLLRVQAVLRR